MIKQDHNMSEIMPIIIASSSDLDSSVMITGVNEFNSRRRRGATMRMNREGVELMCNQSVVEYIEEDQMINMTSPTSLWHLDRIDQSDLPLNGQYGSPGNGTGVDIYIFDTGIRFDHNEFEDRVLPTFYDPVDLITGSSQQGRDCQGHGTHVAALAAGKTFGVAKDATLYSIRVLSCSGSGSFANVILGLNHVIGEKIAQGDRKIIVSMSLRGPISRSVGETIKDATDEGILVVVAAGNDFSDACRFSPGASPDALTVGGSQRQDELYLRLFDGTNYGSCVDIFAPGEDITSAGLSRPDAMATFSGTSQATPLVSGAAAIYWSINSDATAQDIRDDLISTCTRDKLRINQVVPLSFQDTSPNCLLHINPDYLQPQEPQPYQVFYSVSPTQLQNLIEEMGKTSYALTYIDRYQYNSSLHYSLIFKYMAEVEFQTLMFTKLGQLKDASSNLLQPQYQLTLLYDMDSTEYIAVFQKTDLLYSQIYSATNKRHNETYHYQSENNTLISTTVALNQNNRTRYSSVYVEGKLATEHFPSVSMSDLQETITTQYNNKFYLTHFTTISTNPPTYSLVFQQMTRRRRRYMVLTDIGPGEIEETINTQIENGSIPFVITGLDTSDGLKYVFSFEL
ncbi:uncharacterized protein [Dysidea avara]|uniref:uncharacterized protein n=1 Tax=Dysidea avara TaxID=196820 RepID=UPI00331C90FD